LTTLALRGIHPPLVLVLVAAALAWLAAWLVNLPLANLVAFELLGLQRGSQVGEAVAFFLYDVPKVLLLLTGIVWLVSFLRSFVSPNGSAGRSPVAGPFPAPSRPRASGSSRRSAHARPCRCSSASSRPAFRSG
jgi:hypothetical protein